MADAPPLASGLARALFGVHGEALALRQARLQTIASNLANADTPHYLARDLDFAAALRSVTQEASPAGTPTARAPGHLQGRADTAAAFQVYRVPTQASLDGNTVDANTEQAAFAQAAMEYRATLSFVQGRLATLRTAITGE